MNRLFHAIKNLGTPRKRTKGKHTSECEEEEESKEELKENGEEKHVNFVSSGRPDLSVSESCEESMNDSNAKEEKDEMDESCDSSPDSGEDYESDDSEEDESEEDEEQPRNSIEEEGDNRGKLHDAVINGDMHRVRRLLSLSSTDVNETDSNTFHGYGATPLHYGAKYGRLQCVELLLIRGANVEACDCMDATPLHWAALWGHEDVVRLLVMEWKADRLRKTNNGETALDIAKRRGHNYIVSLLSALEASTTLKREDREL